MTILQKGVEYSNLAQGFNATYIMINDLEIKIQNNSTDDYSELYEEIFFLSYLCRREILDRMETYNWDMVTPIIVPMISKNKLTLACVFQQTVLKLVALAEKTLLLEEVTEILEKGDLYFEIDDSIPDNLKNTLL
jgi:hypothetical protein